MLMKIKFKRLKWTNQIIRIEMDELRTMLLKLKFGLAAKIRSKKEWVNLLNITANACTNKSPYFKHILRQQ